MRFNPGHRRSAQVPPTNDIPHYYRYHLDNPGADVLIAAWQCPVNAPVDASAEWFERNCTLPLENVNFVLTGHADEGARVDLQASVAPGIETGALKIVATPTPGYAREPYMLCDIATADDTIRCNWYTWQLTPADITVYAWECPEDYDFAAENANPMADCTGITSGAQFRLRNSEPDHEVLAHAGSYRMGAAKFGDLEPGEYTVAELNPGDGDAETIQWQCFGVHGERAQPVPGTGPEITFSISGGEHILCHRFHSRRRAGKVSR